VVVPVGYKEPGSHLNHNPGLSLDYVRFASDSYVAYQRFQADLLRTQTRAPLTHNFMVQFAELDYYKLAADLDEAALDRLVVRVAGPPVGTPFAERLTVPAYGVVVLTPQS